MTDLLAWINKSDDPDAVAYRDAVRAYRASEGTDGEALARSRAALARLQGKVLPRSFDLGEYTG
jgi:hypothetical protein